MKTFSEYLSAYVAERQISLQKASLLCGMDRTLLSRYISGNRLPENIEKVKNIARGLNMSPQQEKELKILYGFCKSGNCQHKALSLMEQIFSGKYICPVLLPVCQKATYYWPEIHMQRLRGKEEICAAASWIVETSSKLRLQTGGMPECNILVSVLAEADCRIEHILLADYGNRGEKAAENLEKLLPFFLLGKEYHVYCHYHWAWDKFLYGIGMQVLLGDHGLLLFSEDFARGVFTRRAEYQEYYEQIFLETLKESLSFGRSSLCGQQEVSLKNEFVKNPYSGTIFTCENVPYERIRVIMGGKKPSDFYVEELELVKLFQTFMKYADMWGGSMEGRKKR